MAVFTAQDLLKEPVTAEYIPFMRHSGFLVTGFRNRPPFSRLHVREMLTDPRVQFGLWLIKGPIMSNAKFVVKSENTEVQDFVIKSVERFWRTSAVRALKAVEWGYSGSEVIYEVKNGQVHFQTLRDLDTPDVSVVTNSGRLQGIIVRHVPMGTQPQSHKIKVFIGGPKAFLHVHMRERNPWYGLSRLFASFIPWWEQWSDGGYRDVRRLWFYKNAFEGGILYHPPGITRLNDGTIISNKDLAREMIEKKRTGGVIAFPNLTVDASGNRAWEYEAAKPNDIPGGLMEYGTTLRDEILEGMGIPTEVVESSGGEGFGSSSGRAIPQMAFFSTLQEIAQWLIHDFQVQILEPLVALNFGEGIDFEVVPQSLLESANELMSENTEGNIRPPGEPGEDTSQPNEVEPKPRSTDLAQAA